MIWYPAIDPQFIATLFDLFSQWFIEYFHNSAIVAVVTVRGAPFIEFNLR